MSFIAVTVIIGCTTSFLKTSGISSAVTSPTPTVTGDSLIISSVTLGTPTSSSSTTTTTSSPTPSSSPTSAPTTTIYFDTTKSTVPISNDCNVVSSSSSSGTTTSLPCFCQFTWNENNQSGTSSVAVSRKVQTPLISAQTGLVTCLAPSVYYTEIANNTQIAIKLVASPSNSSVFTSSTYTYTKNATTTTGSFSDSQGHLFDNILRYSCYEASTRGQTIASSGMTQTQPGGTNTTTYYMASQFCVATVGGTGSSGSGTCNLPPAGYTAQANYYNLFIRSSERGDINQFGGNFICPLVEEALGSSGTVGTTNQFWPLDSTFALSLGPTADFPVGVVANTQLGDGTSNQKENTDCYPNPSASTVGTGTVSSPSSIIRSCLGFAAQANTDGTCSSFLDSTGQSRQTFRLRRFVAIYPLAFDTNGNFLAGTAQGIDTIYVLDRPVTSSTNTNPLKPYTMRGPKPCPFAYYDKKGLTSSTLTPGYAGTNNSGWNGKNVDGIEFPNQDLSPLYPGGPSCSAALPIINDSQTGFSIVTINKYSVTTGNSQFLNTFPSGTTPNHVYIRPQPPFSPHYEEDTDFVACAPQAVPFVDPPLHFSRDQTSGNVSWCAESYPTQNQNIQSIDPAVSALPTPGLSPSPTPTPSIPNGSIAPYTSHVVNNSASNGCTPTRQTIPNSATYQYQTYGYARHSTNTNWPPNQNVTKASQTCDRTVSSSNLAWTQFPLLGPAPDVEAAISSDSSYACMITYDNNGPKANKTTPSTGCCDSYSVRVPSTQSTTASPNPSASNVSGHLEPDVVCRPPTY